MAAFKGAASMSLNVLFVGGTGQISLSCVQEALGSGHSVTVLNRGTANSDLPAGVKHVVGDLTDPAAYSAVAKSGWDVVCQFVAFTPDDIERDIQTFVGNTEQYVFISTASAYRKPIDVCPVTEDVPLVNPFWEYSRLKASAEGVLQAQSALHWTIVRPSHTVRTRLPTGLSEHDLAAERLLAGKPVIVPGDGSSFWTLTRAQDFAVPFVRLFGNHAAKDQIFHLTSDTVFTWDRIYQGLAAALGVEADIVHVPTDVLVKFRPEWIGPLLGDKANTAVFDNSKIKSIVGEFACVQTLGEILEEPLRHFRERAKSGPHGDRRLDGLIDKIIAAQNDVAQSAM